MADCHKRRLLVRIIHMYWKWVFRGGSRISPWGGANPRWRGHQPPTRALFSENICKNKRIWSCSGGARRKLLHVDPPLFFVSCLLEHHLLTLNQLWPLNEAWNSKFENNRLGPVICPFQLHDIVICRILSVQMADRRGWKWRDNWTTQEMWWAERRN